MNYVEQDRELDQRAQSASAELAEHRWHWTLDETNPDTVSIAEYARQVARSEATIRMYAKAHERIIRQPNDYTMDEALTLANMGAERQQATEQVAKTLDKSIRSMASGQNREIVNDVLATARDRAERNETTVEEEIPVAAEWKAKAAKARKVGAVNRKEKHFLRYIEIDGKIARAKRLLLDAFNIFDGVNFDDDELELLQDAIANLRSLLDLIDLRAGGMADIDWDAEMEKLTEAKGS